MANVEQIMDELRAGLKSGNVHAVKRATDRILAMGLDPDLQLRAQQPLIERTLQILMRRGKEYQDSAHGPSQHFRTVAHIIDTLTPKDWPGIAKILDDHKHEIIKDLLLRMREGWTASAMIAAKDLQRWGQRWPELATIIHTAETDVDSSVLESRDDHNPGSERLLRYLRSDLARSDYDGALEVIGELAWTVDSTDLSELLNPHKQGLIRAMLTTMSNNDSEGVQYIMPQYLNGLAMLGVHWPELDTIKRSVAAMSGEPKDQLDETNPVYAKQDAERAVRGISTHLEKMRRAGLSWEAYYQLVDALYRVLELNRGRADLATPVLEHYKTDIVRTLLWSIKAGVDNHRDNQIMNKMFDAFDRARVNWPEIDTIKRSLRADLSESITVGDQTTEELVSDLEQDLAAADHEAALHILDDLYFHDGVDLDVLLDAHKPGIMRELLMFIKDARTADPVDRAMATRIVKSLRKHGARWPELDIITQSLKAIDDIHEAWSKKYKKSINCAHPRGFSQKAHCAARRKRRAGGKTKSKSVSEAIRGQQRFIQSTADRLRSDLESGRWSEANYTVQRLNQTDPQEVQAIFQPLAPLFAKMIDDDPMGTLGYMNRIMNYADHAYPEMTAAYDAHKTEIMQDLLKMVRSGNHEDWVRQQIYQLKRCGVDWPEFNVITRSLLESTDTTQPEQLGSEGREMVLDIFRRKLAVGHRGIYYVMYHMDNWGLKLSDWPELAEMIEDHKREIVTELLKIVIGKFNNDPKENRASARSVIDRLRRIGVDWPELAVIETSMNADQPKQLDELKGYRADPVYAASQKELAPSKMKTASERDMAMEKLTDYMETQGFKHIGHGSFSSVYLKDGYPWMFKLWSHDPAYLWWITWAAKHQDNPNVPRVKGLPVKIAKDTYVVRLEKLRGLIRREGNLSKGYDKLAYLVDRIESVDDLSKEDLQWIRSEYPGVYDILRVIQRAGSSFVVDLHGDNIMLRGQVPVITDPVVG